MKNPYRLAVILGLIPSCVVFMAVVGDSTPGHSMLQDVRERLIVVTLFYGIFGAIFGYKQPTGSWRWGVWIYIPTFFVIALFVLLIVPNLNRINAPLVEFLLWWFGLPAVAFAAACIGAYTGAQLALRIKKRDL